MIKKMLKWREECEIYLTRICRHRWSGENLMKRYNIELTANTVAFISCRLTKKKKSQCSIKALYFIFSPSSFHSSDVYRCKWSDKLIIKMYKSYQLLLQFFTFFTGPCFRRYLYSIFKFCSWSQDDNQRKRSSDVYSN